MLIRYCKECHMWARSLCHLWTGCGECLVRDSWNYWVPTVCSCIDKGKQSYKQMIAALVWLNQMWKVKWRESSPWALLPYKSSCADTLQWSIMTESAQFEWGNLSVKLVIRSNLLCCESFYCTGALLYRHHFEKADGKAETCKVGSHLLSKHVYKGYVVLDQIMICHAALLSSLPV